MAQTNAKKNNMNRGYIERHDPKTPGEAIGSLELWINSVGTPRSVSTKDGATRNVIDLSTSGHFAKYNGIEYALGPDVFSDKEGLLFVRVAMFDALQERVQKLNLKKGTLVRFYGVFKRNEYTAKDGSKRVSVDAIAHQIEIVWRKHDETSSTDAATTTANATAAPATQAPAQKAEKEVTPPPATQSQTPSSDSDDSFAGFDFL